MASHTIVHTTSSLFASVPVQPGPRLRRVSDRAQEKEPRKPDWLMIGMVLLFLMTLLVVWLVNIPSLLR
jgi:hypothetical protein